MSVEIIVLSHWSVSTGAQKIAPKKPKWNMDFFSICMYAFPLMHALLGSKVPSLEKQYTKKPIWMLQNLDSAGFGFCRIWILLAHLHNCLRVNESPTPKFILIVWPSLKPKSNFGVVSGFVASCSSSSVCFIRLQNKHFHYKLASL